MKDFIKNSLIIFSVMVLIVFFVISIFRDQWDQFTILVQLLVTSIMIKLGQLITNRFTSAYHVVEIAVEMVMVLAVVLIMGWLFGWYDISCLWVMGILFIVIYFICYLLDITRTRKDVDFINNQIAIRKARKDQEDHDA
jgi:F0F1-type ATP synthase assembly protein I